MIVMRGGECGCPNQSIRSRTIFDDDGFAQTYSQLFPK
jgi:hypothetical protein